MVERPDDIIDEAHEVRNGYTTCVMTLRNGYFILGDFAGTTPDCLVRARGIALDVLERYRARQKD